MESMNNAPLLDVLAYTFVSSVGLASGFTLVFSLVWFICWIFEGPKKKGSK